MFHSILYLFWWHTSCIFLSKCCKFKACEKGFEDFFDFFGKLERPHLVTTPQLAVDGCDNALCIAPHLGCSIPSCPKCVGILGICSKIILLILEHWKGNHQSPINHTGVMFFGVTRSPLLFPSAPVGTCLRLRSLQLMQRKRSWWPVRPRRSSVMAQSVGSLYPLLPSLGIRSPNV